MLKQRLLTAAILIPLVVWGVIALSTQWLSWILAAFVVVGAWEWGRLIGLQNSIARIIYPLIIGGMLWVMEMEVPFEDFLFRLLIAAFIWWCVAIAIVKFYEGGTGLQSHDKVLGFLIGAFVLVPPWLALIYIHGALDQGPYLLLFLMILIWGADSGAYFAGRKWGQRKLAPKVSPGKTIEGLLGGLCTSAVVAVAGMFLLDISIAEAWWFIPLCFVVIIFSVVGDLLESLFKRRVGVKDSGQILPGHGGVLDRIDSLTAAAPVFALGLLVFGSFQ